ncbi:E3 ubiquitin-protein ligase TRAIP-like isoform X1 [Frieseomelitta varia]|uniref:E3 ubiquitin-protein ligase TRAIP-like isoform X1 n=1 Tax=Frieseomelitta varia TaxID=561572 RepID=UPI001CB6AD0B|nr:E3 ubiquitin-protein ligase TRAIP-like isoform X1 [Frieseomelitta varia]
MNIVCVICSDLLTPIDDIFHAPCGHIFHFHCVTQWLQRSKTCPQCREKTTLNKIHRLYFNFANNDSIVEDKCSLQDKVDKLSFQLMLKEKEVKHYIEKNEILEKQNKELNKEVKKAESIVNEKTSAIYALKEQIKFFKEQNLEADSRKKEIERLHKRIEEYKNIQILLEASTGAVDEMIEKTNDTGTLITYISVMKREMMISLNKRRELRTKVRSLQQELHKVSMERNFLSDEHSKRIKLEEDLLICESEKISLQNKFRELERSKSSMERSANSKTKNVSDSNSRNSSKEEKMEHTDKKQRKDANIEEKIHLAITRTDSPYLPVKSRGVLALKQQPTEKSNSAKLASSILAKKSRIAQKSVRNNMNALAFDFEGHSKLENLPNSSVIRIRNAKDNIHKVKRLKFDTESNQKLAHFMIN